MCEKRILLWFCVVLLLGGCTIDPNKPVSDRIPQHPQQPRLPASEQSRQMAESVNAFGFDLLRQLTQDAAPPLQTVAPSQPVSPLQVPADRPVALQEPGDNVFISPLSLSLALQLAANGATGDSAEELSGVLHLSGTPEEANNQATLDLLTSLRSEPSVVLHIANSAWIRQDHSFLPGYVERVETYFDASASKFEGPGDEARINGWVSDNTEQMITTIVDELTEEDLSLLLNAVYFRGDWDKAFRRDRTRDDVFWLADGSQLVLPFMHQKASFPFFADYEEGFTAAALPYKFGKVQMVILLPHGERSLAEMLDGLTTAEWIRVVESLALQEIDVSMPRFRMEYDAELNDDLMQMGMHNAFVSWDFERLVEGGTLISYVKHKAVVQVNEEGTVAAAVSAVAVASAGPPSFDVNRPFFFAIHDKETGVILFMGVVYEPEALGEPTS